MYGANKKSPKPFNIHLVGLSDAMTARLNRLSGFASWCGAAAGGLECAECAHTCVADRAVTVAPGPLETAFPLSELVYLTADATDVVHVLDPAKVCAWHARGAAPTRLCVSQRRAVGVCAGVRDWWSRGQEPAQVGDAAQGARGSGAHHRARAHSRAYCALCQANALGIATARFPIDECAQAAPRGRRARATLLRFSRRFAAMSGCKVLTTNQGLAGARCARARVGYMCGDCAVFEVMVLFGASGDWKAAFEAAIPARKGDAEYVPRHERRRRKREARAAGGGGGEGDSGGGDGAGAASACGDGGSGSVGGDDGDALAESGGGSDGADGDGGDGGGEEATDAVAAPARE